MEVPHPPRAAWSPRDTHDQMMGAGPAIFIALVLLVFSPVILAAGIFRRLRSR
jgi:hypothetical protein